MAEQNTSALRPLDEAECVELIAPGGVGRLAYQGRHGLTVLPVNYVWHEGSIVFRTALGGPTDEDLRTGIADADYNVAFEVDHIDTEARAGWSVLAHGAAHHLETETERASARGAGLVTWADGERELFIRITPHRLTGRRIER